jgi:hypothetical protein
VRERDSNQSEEPLVHMKHPEVKDEIIFNFKYNLKEKIKLLNYSNYVDTFGSVNASHLMSDLVPKSGISLRASNLLLAKHNTSPHSALQGAADHHEISQHFKNK